METTDNTDVVVGKIETLPAKQSKNGLLEYAIYQNAPIETLKELMELQERDDANRARKAYHVAMAEFHAETINIIKDKDNTQYGSKYVSKAGLINTVSPFLSKHGLSHRFDVLQPENGNVGVSCILTHRDGHSESVTMSAPPDVSGKKNPIQQIKSTKTYLEIATFESITGLASMEGSLDDDGNAAGNSGNSEQMDAYEKWDIQLTESTANGNPDDVVAFWKKHGEQIKKDCGKVKAAKIHSRSLKLKKELEAMNQ